MDLIFARQMLGEEIRGIDITADLPHGDCPYPICLLYPQGMCLKIAELAQSRLGRNPYRCPGVRPDADWQLETHVSEHTLVAQPSAHGLHEAVELSLAQRQTASQTAASSSSSGCNAGGS